jgi:uncharacterized damage-inducible protein DinB
MKPLLIATALLVICAAPCFEQTRQQELLNDWQESAKQLIEIAEAMPADKYDFKPTKEVRSFGEQVKHVAGGILLLINSANGKHDIALEETYAQRHTKDEIVAALREAFNQGTAAIGKLTDKSGTEIVDSPFVGKMTRANIFVHTLIHNGEHYGQMVVYLRLNGIVPPASRHNK